MSEPTTETGKALHDGLHAPFGAFEQVTGRADCGSLGCGSLAHIAAIEAEAAAQERERIAREIERLPPHGTGHGIYVWRAAVLAIVRGEDA